MNTAQELPDTPKSLEDPGYSNMIDKHDKSHFKQHAMFDSEWWFFTRVILIVGVINIYITSSTYK